MIQKKKKKKKASTEWEKIFSNDMTETGLISKILNSSYNLLF